VAAAVPAPRRAHEGETTGGESRRPAGL